MFAVPRQVLPEIRPSTGTFGDIFPEGTGKAAVPLTAVLGDQHAAMIGQVCLRPGEAKNTYGTGNFLLVNTGSEIVRSKNGLLSTLCYQMEGRPAGLCAGGVGSRDGCGRAMAPGPARRYKQRLRGRDPGRGRRRLRWCLFRPGLLRSFRPVLALGRPRHDRGPDTCQHQGPLGPGHPRSHLFSNPGRGTGHGGRPRAQPGDLEGGRRGHRQRALHAGAGRHSGRAGLPASDRRDHRPGGRLRRRLCGRLLVW